MERAGACWDVSDVQVAVKFDVPREVAFAFTLGVLNLSFLYYTEYVTRAAISVCVVLFVVLTGSIGGVANRVVSVFQFTTHLSFAHVGKVVVFAKYGTMALLELVICF